MTAPWHLTAAEMDAEWDALAAENAALRENANLAARLADPCRTYDRDGKLLTVCHSLADAEARFADEERRHTQTIKERDHAKEMADKLADALATLLGVEIGEHSSGNCPWTAALEAFEERPPDSATHRENERE